MEFLRAHFEERAEEGYWPVTLTAADGGHVETRYYPDRGARLAVVYVGGVGGGWDTPARGLYPRLCEDLEAEGVASLRVRFREPGNMEASVVDVLTGLAFLRSEGLEAAAVVGHSFGGAVVIQAAALDERVRACVTLATQSYGGGPVAMLGPRCATLLIHGEDDHVLPDRCSRELHHAARDPKRLVVHEGAGHGLDEVADDVYQEVHDEIVARLKGIPPALGVR